MHSNNNNKKNHNSTSTPNFQQNNNIFVIANSLLSLEKNVKMQAEQISKLKDQFNQLLRCAVDQQQQPQSRVNRHGLHRMQPYYNPRTNFLQTRQSAPPASQSTDQFGLTEQGPFHQYTHTLRSPQHAPSDTQGIDQFDFIHQHNLCLSQQPSALCVNSTHHHTRLPLSSQQQDTSQFESYYTPLPKQHSSVPPTADKYGLMIEQDQHHYHTHTIQSPLPQQQLHNSSATQTTDQLGLLTESSQQTAPPNQFGLTAGQTSPYYDTHTLRSPLLKQQPVLLTESIDQFGHLTVGQIPNSQQLNSHMLCGEKYPFQPPEFDDSDGAQKNT